MSASRVMDAASKAASKVNKTVADNSPQAAAKVAGKATGVVGETMKPLAHFVRETISLMVIQTGEAMQRTGRHLNEEAATLSGGKGSSASSSPSFNTTTTTTTTSSSSSSSNPSQVTSTSAATSMMTSQRQYESNSSALATLGIVSAGSNEHVHDHGLTHSARLVPGTSALRRSPMTPLPNSDLTSPTDFPCKTIGSRWPTLSSQSMIDPEATIIGRVLVHDFASVGKRSVIRGETENVMVGPSVKIGEDCVISATNVMPLKSGLPATVTIGKNVVVGNNVSIQSSTVENDVQIGDDCVIAQDCVIGEGAKLDAGSVVPPGSFVPSKEHWGGNPLVFKGQVHGDHH